ncbi:hypothetical protein E2C01_022481 [Portunus trituberculatus]|uniref:Uncharacterized protein n=1 Tax=Portunus trituberculatus TaxID=210409 RepID=A0A5B7E7D8_PORTR|nr:hypothetical protein [Portunus trituberculatus]
MRVGPNQGSPLYYPRKVKTLLTSTISYNGPRLFNALPKNVRHTTGCSVPRFKKELDNFLQAPTDEPLSRATQLTVGQPQTLPDQMALLKIDSQTGSTTTVRTTFYIQPGSCKKTTTVDLCTTHRKALLFFKNFCSLMRRENLVMDGLSSDLHGRPVDQSSLLLILSSSIFHALPTFTSISPQFFSSSKNSLRPCWVLLVWSEVHHGTFTKPIV